MINFLLLFLAYLIDIVLGIIFKTSFVGVNMSATPNMLLIVLVLLTYKEDVRLSMLLAFLVGFTLDIFNVDTLFIYAIIYMLTTWVVSAWSTRINDSFIELFLVTLSAVFLKELLLYLSKVSLSSVVLSVGNWGAFHLLFTILFALPLILISVLIKLNNIEDKVREIQRSKKWEPASFR